MELLERGAQLATLREQFAKIDDSGRLVLVTGEAGAGKSALVEAFLADQGPPTEVLFGRCDDLFAPAPVRAAGRHRHGNDPARSATRSPTAISRRRSRRSSPSWPGRNRSIVVLEDLQWADEATLDLLRFVVRRLEPLPCLVVATYRDVLDGQQPAPANARVVRRARRHPHRAGTALGRVRAHARGRSSDRSRCALPRAQRRQPVLRRRSAAPRAG